MKVNVDELKEGFVSQTMLMAQMETSINEMKGSIEDLQVGLGFKVSLIDPVLSSCCLSQGCVC